MRRGNYNYRELLTEYRGRLSSLFPKTDGLVTTDIDETLNRIVVGVRDEVSAEAARRLLAMNGYTDRLVMVGVEPVPRSNSVLTDPLRPVPGGARINMNASNGPACTLGFNLLKYMGTFDDTVATARYFVTSAHCTSSQWSTESSQAFQAGSFFGQEIGDPQGFTDPPCDGYVCRYSDGSVFQFLYDSISPRDGEVAYPADTGSLTFSSHVSMLDTPTPYVNEIVHMIGSVSGRRRGSVQASCVDVWDIDGWGNRKMLCQNKASYFAQDGDSGAPVIVLYSATTGGALGLHWSSQATQGGQFLYSWFSPMYSALYEFFYNLPGAPNFSPVVY